MKITFLGTGGGGEYPAIWCRCENCSKARKLGGKNIRRNSALFMDDDTMIDIGKTAHVQADLYGCDLCSVTTLLITHSHLDHFNTHTLWAHQMREGADKLSIEERLNVSTVRFSPLPRMTTLGSAQVEKTLTEAFDHRAPSCDMDFITVEPFKSYRSGDIEIFTLDANHNDGISRGINYIITRKNRTFLYMVDTGYPFDETLEALKDFRFDFVIVESSFGFGADTRTHMRLEKNERLLAFMKENNVFKDDPHYYLTHISPHWCPPHDEYAPYVAEKGFILAHDGMKVEYPY